MNLYMTPEGVEGFKFPREGSLWEKKMARRWALRKIDVKNQWHYRKEEDSPH